MVENIEKRAIRALSFEKKWGFKTTTGKMREDINKVTEWRNPHTGKVEPRPPGMVFEPDHILPADAIADLPGFKDLTPDQRRSLIHDEGGLFGNISPLPRSENASKGPLSVTTERGSWEKYKGNDIHPDYQNWLNQKQIDVQDAMTKQIETWLQGKK